MLYTKEADKQSSYVLWECHYSQLFNMDFIHNVTMTNPDDLAEILNHCLIAVETCTRRLALKRPPTPCRSCRERKRDLLCYHSGSAGDGESDDNANNNYHGPIVQPRILPAYDRCKEKPATSHSGAMFCDQIDSHHSSSSLTDSRNKLADSLSTPGITSPSDDSERQQSQRKEARAVYKRAPDGSLVKADVTPCTQTISLPLTIRDLHVEALMSGAVIYPGCRDVRGAALVIVFCKHPAWRMEYFTSQELAKILLYYYTVPRKDVAHKGLTVIADARGTTPPVLNAFLETLYTVQASQPGAIYISHVLADKVAQSLLFRSPVFRPQVNLKIDLVMSVETLYKFVSPEHLPPELGGYLHNDHVSWVQFRLKLESFLKQCRDVGEQLVHLMREMSALECLPATAPDASHQVELHKQCASQALEGDTLLLLREQGCSVLSSLSTHQHDLADNEDFRSSLHAAEHLYNQVQDTATKLSQLAKDHLHRLETCNQRHLLETQMSELLSWLETEGDRILEKHRVVADNLKAIRKQQKEFENAYFSAMTQLEKGSDLLEEANLLSQSDAASDVTCGVSDLSAELKERMSEYTGRLEDVRERIEDTSRCYHMLDKSYEWALNAMKYAASLKLDRLTSTENVDDLIHGLDVYTKDNPPLGADTFDLMLELSKRLDNDKLYDQCKTARARCKETEQLLRERAAKLRQAKERLARADGGRRIIRIGAGKEPSDDSAGTSPGKTAGPTTPTSPTSPATTTTAADCSALSRSFDSSPGDFQSSPGPFANKDLYVSHLMNALRRRSYAGKPSAPLYNPGVAAFKESVREMNLWEYEEYLFNEGLITEDMSDRIVAFLPKGLSDLTMRGSRESLRESVDNLAQLSADGASPDRKSDSLPRDLGASVKDSSKAAGTTLCTPPSLGTTLNKHNKPHRKMLKKATSCSLPDSNVTETLPSIREQRDIRSVSMITASTESLPCMPEEDTVPSGTSSSQPQSADTSVTSLSHKECDPSATPPITTERKFGWSPVPVNTHLMYRQSQPVTLTASQSMADLRVTENQVKRRRILSLILHEMIQTERDYVKSLQFIIENYIPEISRQDVPQTLRGKRSIIFGNIEKIYEFHSLSFLAELEKCQTNPYSVCHAFLKHDQEFFLYALYNKNKPKSDALMAEYGMAFFKKKQVELGDRMDLNSYLLKPVQRMGKYALLLKQIIKECAETDPEYNDLCAAMEMVKFQLRHGNDLLAMDCLKDCDVNLQEQGMLLRQDEFLVWQGRKKSLRHVFLFEEMVLFSKTKRTSSGQDLYIYKNSLKTSDLGLTESVADSKHKFEIWFRKRTAGGTFTLQAPTMDVKNAWVKEISMLLWKQAFRNRERRLSEAARMGIGRKPCMDLKPSQHNIQDRFVNIAISNSGSSIPRMRNSIAVSSFEHLRNGGKRPHSLVSVSSSSSAGSNQSSNSGCVTVQPNSGSLDVVHEDQRVPDVARQYPYPTETNMDMVDLTTNLLSPSSSMEDACTQTTLRRPLKHKDGPCDESCV